MTLTIGIDDAGRGPVIGPMILAGVLLNTNQEKTIKSAGATDSKLLTHPTRIRISTLIKKISLKYKILQASPDEIDQAIIHTSNMNLNTLEAKKAGEIINNLSDKKDRIKVIIDCPSINISSWKSKLLEFVEHPQNLTIRCENKADLNHTSVAAASILAKVTREEEVTKIKKMYASYGDIGSGYPSDPVTKKFLKNNGLKLRDSGIFRKSWSTWKKMFPDRKQSTLDSF